MHCSEVSVYLAYVPLVCLIHFYDCANMIIMIWNIYVPILWCSVYLCNILSCIILCSGLIIIINDKQLWNIFWTPISFLVLMHNCNNLYCIILLASCWFVLCLSLMHLCAPKHLLPCLQLSMQTNLFNSNLGHQSIIWENGMKCHSKWWKSVAL